MSEMMTAVLRMPYKLAMVDELSRRQFYSRAQEALGEVTRLREEVERLENNLKWKELVSIQSKEINRLREMVELERRLREETVEKRTEEK